MNEAYHIEPFEIPPDLHEDEDGIDKDVKENIQKLNEIVFSLNNARRDHAGVITQLGAITPQLVDLKDDVAGLLRMLKMMAEAHNKLVTEVAALKGPTRPRLLGPTGEELT